MQKYKIIGVDGKEYGPVSAETITQWIQQRRVNNTTSVQQEGSADWKPLAEYPEFQEALAKSSSPAFPQQAPSFNNVQTGGTKTGLAITSMVLGISSMFCVGIPAIFAIITGHIALNRCSKSPKEYSGKGMAIAGLILGYFSLLIFVAFTAAMLLPALAQAKNKSSNIKCVSNLKQIGLAARIYSGDNNGVFPTNFLCMSNELSTPKILFCPSDPNHQQTELWSSFNEDKNVSYEFIAPGIKEASAMGQPIFRCPVHGNICYGDGSVQQGRKTKER